MPAKDIFHEAVKQALEKEGWIITHDPYTLKIEDEYLYVDLGAERMIAAQRGSEKIAVEVKSFVKKSLLSAFHELVGQFINYQTALQSQEQEKTLFVAVPEDAYKSLFQKSFVQHVVRNNHIKLIIFEPDEKIILQWNE